MKKTGSTVKNRGLPRCDLAHGSHPYLPVLQKPRNRGVRQGWERRDEGVARCLAALAASRDERVNRWWTAVSLGGGQHTTILLNPQGVPLSSSVVDSCLT